MASTVITHLLFPLAFLVILFSTAASRQLNEKLYIVYMGDVPSPDIQDYSQTAATASHLSLLHSLHGSYEAAQESFVHSYWKSFNGFAAWLSSSHAQHLSNTDGIVSVFESKKAKPLTSRSWDFVGLPLSQQTNDLEYQSDVIVGVLDTGVWPESESFDDKGLGPIPSKWKGVCQTTPDFKSCNKKIIGASFYNKGSGSEPEAGEFISPRDSDGHGTHTASTAAGSIVKNASLFGFAQGDARGGVPGARIAIYKVCFSDCSDVDILAAFDDAIHDGVDIISVSIGYSNGGFLPPLNYFEDSIAIGAFHAMKRGILTSNAACNDGSVGTVCNYSPWSLTVAASSIDRQFKSQLNLGNQTSFEGRAINTFTMEQPWYPLVYGGDATNVSGGFSSQDSSGCKLYSLDRSLVEGKIVLCYLADPYDLPDGGVYVSGGAGAIIMYDPMNDTASSFIVPATLIFNKEGEVIRSYINSTSSPTASIEKGVVRNDLPAPIVASFSSKGPNQITPNLLKPDITAPGVDILAAWSKAAPMTTSPLDKRVVDFNIVSGTSMACPHATGAAAYVKSFHPDWSPAAIKSALMTTASTFDATLEGNRAGELGYGSGQINPLKAINPGLVYEADAKSYINMLCSQGYNETSLRLLTGESVTCSSKLSENGVWELNYPSMMIVRDVSEPIFVQFPRTVTNVGPPKATYQAKLDAPLGMNVTVEPDTLSFTSSNQKMSYNVKIESRVVPDDYALLSGALTWSSGNYSVRSPIVVYYVKQ
ncbi:hypothetical protein SUGI_1422340 [Cryptomeria japonica]|uniref:Uncharacterized protein n=1 Tax=Cryptomeria japonica TaxID=3369 RepID=A0AAD3NRW4_CRYJA|nr:subtilisin-like protease SBT4.14 [Cryptomeria japonica]XP_059071650.1 subtilisin-like protease SBT4.14 [Cryptomeria japonica]XP_059071797.1 subtilisin-like protease SBT4.14 [Cryptomeria japonica]GLJ18269.1 hypothetical protein SUGI_0323040 [Cryptomeria japonica]GLJ57928.1 hypothetical protein SUGI_1391590 [Cryptomeria japonica]GLJ58171.1 hypothetical protein SUGI_1422340 [Cryptomeria japonica]